MEKQVIRTDFNNAPRGTYYFKSKLFRRDNVPVFKGYVMLEKDVIDKLARLGCADILFILRDGRQKRFSLANFIKDSNVKLMGQTGDEREQYMYYVATPETETRKLEQAEAVLQRERDQGRLF